ncbi:MAG: hypothetical protein M0C28_06625 [Candidatus Moduliflexus flocculans]|nr:hypothetical protein [Candidatus Moduliflexus flocculans]
MQILLGDGRAQFTVRSRHSKSTPTARRATAYNARPPLCDRLKCRLAPASSPASAGLPCGPCSNRGAAAGRSRYAASNSRSNPRPAMKRSRCSEKWESRRPLPLARRQRRRQSRQGLWRLIQLRQP